MLSNFFFKNFYLLIFILLIQIIQSATAAPNCGPLEIGIGPRDYNKLDEKDNRKILYYVEKRHFTPQVENLIRGQSTYDILSDLTYTLHVFPNHHRALLALAKYEIKQIRKHEEKGLVYVPKQGSGFSITADCYFNRALRYRPDDSNVYLTLGIYLHLKGNLDQAFEAYKKSEDIQPNSADLQYNMGLLYFEKKQYQLAKDHAKRAYQLGYPLPGLRDKLAKIGQWP